MLRHVDLYNDRENQNTYCLYQIATLCRISPHLELETMTTHILKRAAPIEPESRLQIVPAVVIVPQELVIWASTEKTLRVIVGTGPDLIDDVLGERML